MRGGRGKVKAFDAAGNPHPSRLPTLARGLKRPRRAARRGRKVAVARAGHCSCHGPHSAAAARLVRDGSPPIVLWPAPAPSSIIQRAVAGRGDSCDNFS